jgi:hypothetical protein
VEIGATEHATPESSGSERGQVAHSVTGSKTAQEPAAEEESTAEEEHAIAHEGFSAFGGRGESGSTEAEPATSEADPLSEEKTQAASPEATEAAPPRQSAEKQAAAEVIHGGFR